MGDMGALGTREAKEPAEVLNDVSMDLGGGNVSGLESLPEAPCSGLEADGVLGGRGDRRQAGGPGLGDSLAESLEAEPAPWTAVDRALDFVRRASLAEVNQLLESKLNITPEKQKLLAPGACLVLFILVSIQPFLGSTPDVDIFREGQGRFRDGSPLSLTIPYPDMLPAACSDITRLPYVPANAASGPPEPHGVLGFVLVSAHRLSDSAFIVLGLSPPSLRPLWGSYQEACLWISFEGPKAVQGVLSHHFVESSGLSPSEEHMYQVVALHCKLNQSTPAKPGGALLVNIQETDEVLVYRESPGQGLPSPAVSPSGNLTICSTLLTTQRMGLGGPLAVLQHIEFMSFLGADSFLLYDGGALSADATTSFGQLAAVGRLEVLDFRRLTKFSTAWDTVVANDCIHRSRFRASWVVLLSPDEFPSVSKPDAGLRQLLRDSASVPWVSMGVFVWDSGMCVRAADALLLPAEHMRWRQAQPLCFKQDADPSTCPDEFGFRRVLVDPRRVGLVTAHRVVFPQLDGRHLSTDDARVNKFTGLSVSASLACEYPVPEEHQSKEWTRDDTLSKVLEQSRKTHESAASDQDPFFPPQTKKSGGKAPET